MTYQVVGLSCVACYCCRKYEANTRLSSEFETQAKGKLKHCLFCAIDLYFPIVRWDSASCGGVNQGDILLLSPCLKRVIPGV